MASATLRLFPRIARSLVWNQPRTVSIAPQYLHYSTEPQDPQEPAGIITGNTEPPLPLYRERVGEDPDLMKARLLYQSRKRGMLENGLLLSTFAGEFLDKLNQAQLKMYDTLINKPTNDWEIYYWMTGLKEAPEEYNNEVLTMLKQHAMNKNKESRVRQPDLKFD